MYALAGSLHDEKVGSAMFLRAERREDGTRTFKVIPRPPLPTSHGKDLYRQLFQANATEPLDSGQRRSETDLAIVQER
jgi:hypothetical protein